MSRCNIGLCWAQLGLEPFQTDPTLGRGPFALSTYVRRVFQSVALAGMMAGGELSPGKMTGYLKLPW